MTNSGVFFRARIKVPHSRWYSFALIIASSDEPRLSLRSRMYRTICRIYAARGHVIGHRVVIAFADNALYVAHNYATEMSSF